MKTFLSYRILATALFATIGLIGLYPATFLMVAPLRPLPDPWVFWLSWLTALAGIFAALLGLSRITAKRPAGIASTVLAIGTACSTLYFIPLSQYTSPGMDCPSGCIVEHTTLAPGLVTAVVVCYIVGGCALVTLLTLGSRHRRALRLKSK